MPSLPNLDEFPYSGQDEDLPACVVECAVMVCEYLEVDYSWKGLADQLDFDSQCGTPFDNIASLSGIRVTPVTAVEEVEGHFTASEPAPVIANLLIVDDEVLGYGLAFASSLHAVVVLAIDAYQVTFSDPLSHAMLSTESHRVCSRADFEQAWLGGYALRKFSSR
jgi:hypothetical protein